MHRIDVVQRFIEYCETDSPSIGSLAVEFQQAIEVLGFRHFACCSHVDPLQPPPEAVMMHNYPPAWARAFSEARLYEIDPVLKRAECSLFPFSWDTAFRTAPITQPQKRILAEAACYGLAHGYTVPLHLSWLPGALRASCSVIPDSERIDVGSYFAVQVLATHLYALATRIHVPWPDVTPTELTSRERQCLVLVAQGKDEWTIGRVLGLSKSTVHYHLGRVKQRFRVTTAAQAVFNAVVTGQITYYDVYPMRRGEALLVGASTHRR